MLRRDATGFKESRSIESRPSQMQSPDNDSSKAPPQKLQRVWDAPVRITHAIFISCIVGAWLTRSAELADLHAVFGYTALAALAFRIVWGFVGPAHARFAAFAYSPTQAVEYLLQALRGSVRHYTGHNPAGSWAVYLLLALIFATCTSGIIASAALHHLGPLAGLISFEFGDASFSLHEILAWVVLATVALHLLGVAWGSHVHRENLAAAMLTGRKIAHEPDAADAPARRGLAAAIVLIALVGAAAYLEWHVPREAAALQGAEDKAKAALASRPWGKECGSCHLAYPPALLPMRSWERTMREQEKHFGEDLSLSEASVARLLQAASAAPSSWGAWKLNRSAPAGDAPLRITELPFWRHAHEGIAEARFKPPGATGRHDCEACHRDAASGIFHPRMIQSAKPRTSP